LVRNSGFVRHKKGIKKEAGLEPPYGAEKVEKNALLHNPNLPKKPQFFAGFSLLIESLFLPQKPACFTT